MIRAKKSFGQHFLKSPSVVSAIIKAAELRPGEIVVEVGPGTGVLTRALVETGARAVAIEADRDLFPGLEAEFGDRIKLVEGDALKVDLLAITTPTPRPNVPVRNGRASFKRRGSSAYKLIANLPYNVGTKILKHFLTSEHPPIRCVVMVQKEVGERMLACPGKMSLLSVAIQLYTDPTRVTNVSSGSFSPPPRVDSVVVRLDWNPKIQHPEAVMTLAKAGFRARRKQLHRNLADAGILESEKTKAWLRVRGLTETARAQELSPKDWIDLCYNVSRYGRISPPDV